MIRRVSGVEDRVSDSHAFEGGLNPTLGDIDAMLRESAENDAKQAC